jgi:hypothetical protein
VIQDHLLDYLQNQFRFDHLTQPRLGDSMHIHAYNMMIDDLKGHALSLSSRLSTDSEGIAVCLGLQAEASIELHQIVAQLEAKISDVTRFELR